MKVYVVRHGETEYNKNNVLQGMSNSPLTEKGLFHAQKLAEYALKKKIKKVYSSPLKRALFTAQEVSVRNNIEIFIDEQLKEICYGSWEGLSKEELKKEELWPLREKNKYAFIHPGSYKGVKGESYKNAFNRAKNFFESLKEEDSPVLIVSHLGVCRNIYKLVSGCSNKEAVEFSPKNNQVIEIDKTTKTIEIYYF